MIYTGNYKNSLNSECNNVPSAKSLCPSVPSSQWSAIETVWKYNRGCVPSYTNAKNVIVNFATTYPTHYLSEVDSCLFTMSKYTKRSDGGNAASDIRNTAYSIANNKTKSPLQRTGENLAREATFNLATAASGAFKVVQNTYNEGAKQVGGFIKWATDGWNALWQRK